MFRRSAGVPPAGLSGVEQTPHPVSSRVREVVATDAPPIRPADALDRAEGLSGKKGAGTH
ncbi:hypothetical protein ABZT06_49755 [Streptomyces sp. NPDC005483]|uniref:hypothetical protein n=1 Tax=Streptomyces sp. NPDC005483 TaxID=3154882 RepID=UPI0033A51E46